MRRSGLAATAALVTWCAVFGGAAGPAQGQSLGGDGIVIVGVDLSGQWDFRMTVISRSDPSIPATDTLTGSFMVTGGAPTYSGSGTFNGLPAAISGTAEVIPGSDPATFSITLRDHIASKDSETHFTGQLFGDLGTGTFTGTTLDGSATWDGVFDIKITRPTTQTPEEQIGSAFQAALAELSNTVTISQESMEQRTSEFLARMRASLTLPGLRDAHQEGIRALDEARRLTREQAKAVVDRFVARVDEIVRRSSPTDRKSLSRLAGKKTGDIQRARSIATGQIGMFYEEAKKILRAGLLDLAVMVRDWIKELKQLRGLMGFALALARGGNIAENLVTATAFQGARDCLEGAITKMESNKTLTDEEKECLKKLLCGIPIENPEPGDDDPTIPGLVNLIKQRADGNKVEAAPGEAEVIAQLFGQGSATQRDRDRIEAILIQVFNGLSPEDAREKLRALEPLRRLLGC